MPCHACMYVPCMYTPRYGRMGVCPKYARTRLGAAHNTYIPHAVSFQPLQTCLGPYTHPRTRTRTQTSACPCLPSYTSGYIRRYPYHTTGTSNLGITGELSLRLALPPAQKVTAGLLLRRGPLGAPAGGRGLGACWRQAGRPWRE